MAFLMIGGPRFMSFFSLPLSQDSKIGLSIGWVCCCVCLQQIGFVQTKPKYSWAVAKNPWLLGTRKLLIVGLLRRRYRNLYRPISKIGTAQMFLEQPSCRLLLAGGTSWYCDKGWIWFGSHWLRSFRVLCIACRNWKESEDLGKVLSCAQRLRIRTMALVTMISGIPISPTEHAACCDSTKHLDIDSTDWYLVFHSGTKAASMDQKCGPHTMRSLWAMKKTTLFCVGYIGDEILPSHLGIIIYHCKDPY